MKEKDYIKDIYCLLGCIFIYLFGSVVPGIKLIGLFGSIFSSGLLLSNFKIDKWEKIFLNCGLCNKDKKTPKLVEYSKNDIGDKYIFSLPYGLCEEDFEKLKSEIETAIKHPILLSSTNNFKIVMQIFNVKYKDFYKPFYDVSIDSQKLKFPIGISITPEGERIVILDLDSQSHMLVGGITGSGKTSFLKCLLTAMCLQNIELKIIDMKMGSDYNIFKNYKYLTAFIKDVEAAEEEIENIKEEMMNRFKKLDKNNCNLKEYNKKYKNKMNPIIVLIEEYTMLSDDKKFNKELNILLAQARAVNIKIILSIQRPCHENLSTKLKANLNHTVAFKVKNTYNSEILLDKGDYRAVTDLHAKGEAILSNENTDIMFKSYFLEDREIKKLIFMKLNMGNIIPIQKTKTKSIIKDAKEVSLCD